jgi:hypothetical protein
VFIPHVLDLVVLANQFLTTVRAHDVFVFPAVLILSANFHVSYPLVLALSLLTQVFQVLVGSLTLEKENHQTSDK